MYQKRLAAGPARTHSGSLQRYPKPPAKFKGSGSREKRRGQGTWKDRRDGNRGEGQRKGEGTEGEDWRKEGMKGRRQGIGREISSTRLFLKVGVYGRKQLGPEAEPRPKWILYISEIRRKKSTGTPFPVFLSDGGAPKTTWARENFSPFSHSTVLMLCLVLIAHAAKQCTSFSPFP